MHGIGYDVGAPASASGTITNDDADVTVAVSPSSVAEDGLTNLVYTFTRTGFTGSMLTVNFTVGGTATFNTDYAASGATTFTASAGTTTVRIISTDPIPAGALAQGTMLTVTQGAAAAAVTDTQVVASVQAEPLQTNPPLTTYRVTFRDGLRTPFSLDPANAATVQSEEFHFRVSRGAAVTSYDNLALDPSHPRYVVRIVNAAGGPAQNA